MINWEVKMKKIIILTLITVGLVGPISAMEGEKDPGSGFNLLSLAGDLGSFLSTKLEELDREFNYDEHDDDQGDEQNDNIEHNSTKRAKKWVRQELNNKRLSQAITDSTQQENSKDFIKLLIGMKALDMRASQSSETVIKNYLDVLQQQHKQKTKELLQARMEKGQELHALRKQFADKDDDISDDEEYTDLKKFMQKLLKN